MHPAKVACFALFLLASSAGHCLAESKPSTAGLGTKIDTAALADAAIKDKKAVVVVFLSFECPVSNGYAAVLTTMAKEYGERGVAFIGVGSADDMTADQLAKQAREFGLPFAVQADPKRRIAEALQAEVTPEAFVLDGGFILRYRGRIDDQYSARLKKNAEAGRHDLKQALDEVLAGKPVSVPATRAVGCSVQRRAKGEERGAKETDRSSLSAPRSPLYHRDVVPILQKHCQSCHRPGEVGPFPLMSYRQAVNWADDIKETTRSRQMPPWKPASDFVLHGERRLSDAEIATISAWVDGGAPEGDAKEAPPPRRFPEGWQLGDPDLVLTVDDDFQLGPSGFDVYRCFVLPTDLAEDRYVTAVEVRAGNRRVVHHAVLFFDRGGRARKLAEREKQRDKKPSDDRGPGYTVPLALAFLPGFLPEGGLGGWAPGLMPHRLPDGMGHFLPKGADVVMQLHYHRSGRVEKDRTTVGLYFSKKPEGQRLRDVPIPGHFLFIPAGEERFKVEGSIWMRQDCTIHTIIPHMHLIGREIKMTMVPADGPPRTLVDIKDWDFNWQELYFPKEPIAVKSGTRFDIAGIYDNSAKNERNPFRPARNIFAGLETTNEMCVGFLAVSSAKPGPVRFDMQPRIQGLKWSPNWGIPGLGF